MTLPSCTRVLRSTEFHPSVTRRLVTVPGVMEARMPGMSGPVASSGTQAASSRPRTAHFFHVFIRGLSSRQVCDFAGPNRAGKERFVPYARKRESFVSQGVADHNGSDGRNCLSRQPHCLVRHGLRQSAGKDGKGERGRGKGGSEPPFPLPLSPFPVLIP